MTATGILAFTAAVRMVHRVHRNAAIMWTFPSQRERPALPIVTFSWSRVANLSNGRHAILRNFSGFARRQLHQRVFAFFRDQLRRTTGGTHHLRALAGLQFNIVDRRAWRNIL